MSEQFTVGQCYCSECLDAEQPLCHIVVSLNLDPAGLTKERAEHFAAQLNFLARFPGIDLSTARVAVPCRECKADPTYCGGCKGPHAALGERVRCFSCRGTLYTILEPKP